jgi:hypothetical protein
MKAKPLLFLLILVLPLLAEKCDKNEIKPNEELDKLPPASQTGAYTFGCLINNIAFKPNGGIFAGSHLRAFYQYTDDTYYFNVTGSKNADTEKLPAVTIETTAIIIKPGKTYKLMGRKRGSAFATYNFFTPDHNKVSYDTGNGKGELYISKLDSVNQIVSGTFWFDGLNPQGDIVQVREGRFDLRFTR